MNEKKLRDCKELKVQCFVNTDSKTPKDAKNT